MIHNGIKIWSIAPLRKMTINIRLLSNTLVFLLILSGAFHKPVKGDTDALPLPGYTNVELIGFALQGNGGNYAATLSAIAESLEINAEHAISLQQSGVRKGFMFPSFVGASSGSLVVSIASSLIQNENLFPNPHKDRIFSAQEVGHLARAFRYMGFVADESNLERAVFFSRSIFSILKGVLGLDHVSYKFARLLKPEANPIWWTKSLARSEAVLYDFTKVVFVAQNLTPSMILTPLSKVNLSKKDRQLASQFKWQYVSDLPRVQEEQDANSKTIKLVKKIARHIRLSAEQRVRSLLVKRNYMPFLRHIFINYADARIQTDNPLKGAMVNHKLAEGYMSAAFVLWKEAYHHQASAALPSYEDQDFRPMVFASAETSKRFLQDESFYSGEAEKPLLLATVPHIHGAVLPSTKEPYLLEVVAGHASDSSKYSISSIHDFRDGREYIFNGKPSKKDPWVGTLGGFINVALLSRLAAFQLYLKAAELQQSTEQTQTNLSTKLLIVSKSRAPGKSDFARGAIEQSFSKKDKSLAKKNLEAFESHARRDIDHVKIYESMIEGLGVPSKVQRLGLDWSLTGFVPASQAGVSYKLVYVIANEVRKQLDKGQHLTLNLLTPTEESRYTSPIGTTFDLYGQPVATKP